MPTRMRKLNLARSNLLIVGAGPAGCAAAAIALAQNLSVTIIDKFEFPRDKLCGGLITGRSMKMLRDTFGFDPSSELFLETSHIRIWSGSHQLVDKPSAPAMYMTMRRQLDHAMLEYCISRGARVVCGTVAQVGTNCVTLRDGQQLDFDVLIGADGANSTIAKVGLKNQIDVGRLAFGLEIEAPRPSNDHDAVDLDLDAIAWGYGWSFPKKQSRTIGVGGLHNKNSDPKALMRAYKAKVAPTADRAPEKGAFLPFGDFLRKPGKNEILVAGDAAGLVDPITGEGIALALESGALAARAAAAAIKAKKPQEAAKTYCRSLTTIHRDLRYAKMIRFIMFHNFTRKTVQNAFANSAVTDMYLRLLAGEINYPTIAARFMKKLPRIVLRSLFARPQQSE